MFINPNTNELKKVKKDKKDKKVKKVKKVRVVNQRHQASHEYNNRTIPMIIIHNHINQPRRLDRQIFVPPRTKTDIYSKARGVDMETQYSFEIDKEDMGTQHSFRVNNEDAGTQYEENVQTQDSSTVIEQEKKIQLSE